MKAKRLWVGLALAALVFALVSAGCDGGYSAKTGASAKHKVKLPLEGETYDVVGQVEGLDNFVVRYDDRFYRGGQVASSKGARWLREKGVRTVISVTPDDAERALVAEHGMMLVELPFETGKMSPAHVAAYLHAIDRNPGPYYVHCHGGTHRGGVLGVAWRMHVEGWAYEQAEAEFDRLGGDPVADAQMLEAVRDYDAE
jgi:protein tyrosine phosphatase (PTP) superfamily phosphohydrolase (DUF442 family)